MAGKKKIKSLFLKTNKRVNFFFTDFIKDLANIHGFRNISSVASSLTDLAKRDKQTKHLMGKI